jgi:hypothetical protein
VKPAIGRMIDEGFDFDLIDAHYFYPDGVAAAMLGPLLQQAGGDHRARLGHHAVPALPRCRAA